MRESLGLHDKCGICSYSVECCVWPRMFHPFQCYITQKRKMVERNETEHQDVNTCYKNEPRIEVPSLCLLSLYIAVQIAGKVHYWNV